MDKGDSQTKDNKEEGDVPNKEEISSRSENGVSWFQDAQHDNILKKELSEISLASPAQVKLTFPEKKAPIWGNEEDIKRLWERVGQNRRKKYRRTKERARTKKNNNNYNNHLTTRNTISRLGDVGAQHTSPGRYSNAKKRTMETNKNLADGTQRTIFEAGISKKPRRLFPRIYEDWIILINKI